MRCRIERLSVSGRGLDAARRKICRTSVPAAALAVVALVSASAFAQRGPGARLQLNLSPDQQQKMQRLFRDTEPKSREVREGLHATRMDFYGQLRNYRMDDHRLKDDMHRTHDLQVRLLSLNLDNQSKLRSVLTADQFNNLRQAVANHRPPGGETGLFERGDGPPGDIKSLGLNADQQARINKLWKTSQETMEGLRKRLNASMQSLEQLYLNYDLNPQRAKPLIGRIADTRLAMLTSTLDRHTEMRKILTEEQFKTLVKSIPPPREGPASDSGTRRWRGDAHPPDRPH